MARNKGRSWEECTILTILGIVIYIVLLDIKSYVF